ncbi:1,5-anhydro-D-fructose reductase [Chrysoperla carnea]|uniref:1,5-anhydro-D-fructose reductase n=1 Tax=Chrysoperla carnea TaxID=189513 RepID=UPI001D085699|nr:1,5-anhydro-D-fructose reductase [Chrysoperla carnea]
MACKINIDLGNGKQMPALGFGTWQATDAELENALESALEAGYRHIDTAYVYENEAVIGRVLTKWIKDGRLKREDLFIVTKLPPTGNKPSGVEKFLTRSLKNLNVDYLDLYLVHTPFTFAERGEDIHPFNENGEILIDTSTDHVAVWKEMEKQLKAGKTKSIGISNFNKKQIERILSNCEIKPSNLQIELHLYFQQNELVNYCKGKGITITAYSPLGAPGIGVLLKKLNAAKEIPDELANETVKKIAEKYNVTPAQILLRYTVQRGIAAIPKSINPTRIKANISIFHFELDNGDITELKALDQGSSGRVCDFKFFKGIDKHPEYPFPECL